MEVIFILLPLAILIAGVMLALFIWAVKDGQYDDLETPAHRILFDQEETRSPNKKPDANGKVGEASDAAGGPSASVEQLDDGRTSVS